MKAETRQLKRLFFLASLVVIALIINAQFTFNGQGKSSSQPTQVASTAARRDPAPEPVPKVPVFDAVAFRKQFLSDNGSTSSASTIAVGVASEKRNSNSKVSQTIIRHCQNSGAQFTMSFFKPQFFSDRIFDDTFSGSQEVFEKLNLQSSLAGMLLARQTVSYTTNSALQNLITADMRLDIVFFQFKGGTHWQTWSFEANGAGFNESAARGQAEDRIAGQIDKDANFGPQSLNIN